MNNLGWIIAIVLGVILLMMWSGKTPAAVQRLAEDDPNFVCEMQDSQGRTIKITAETGGPEFANLCRQQERRPMYFWSYPYPFFIIRRPPPPPPPPMP